MRATYLRVGLLMLAGLGLLVGAALFFGGSRIRHRQGYETYFRDSVQGLDVGAPVKYRGVSIGAVTEIGLTSAEYGAGRADLADPAFRAVIVRFAIDTARLGEVWDAGRVAGQGLRARVAPQGLTGASYVELNFTDASAYPPLVVPWTPSAGYIPSMPGTIAQVTDAATVLLGRFERVDVVALADGALGLIRELRGSLRDGEAHQLATQSTATLRALQEALAAADVPALAAELRQTLAAARTLAQGPQTRALLRSATAATSRLTEATARLPQLIASLEQVALRADTGAADAEAALTPLLRDARTTVAALRQSSEALRRDPSEVVLGGPPPRSRNP